MPDNICHRMRPGSATLSLFDLSTKAIFTRLQKSPTRIKRIVARVSDRPHRAHGERAHFPCAQEVKALKFSIVTAVYNRQATIAQAVASVSAQSYQDVEHLIIDGASKDGTMQEVDRVKHAKMRVISEPDRGIYDALNKGIRHATGEVVGMMHSDDFFAHHDVLEKVASAFSSTGADAVYGDLDYVASKDTLRVIRHWWSGEFKPENLARGWMPPHPTLFIKREAMISLGLYNTDYQISADYEAILRWFGKGGLSLSYIPEVLVKMRVGGESNRSLGQIIRKSREDYRALRSNGVGGLQALARKNLSKLPQFLNKKD